MEIKKDKLIRNLIKVRKEILNLVSSLSPKQREQNFLGVWSINDLLAHLTGWDEWNIKAIKEIMSGKLPSFYSLYDSNWASFNSQLVKKNKQKNFKKLLTLIKQSQQRLINFLKIIPSEEFNKDHGLKWKSDKITIAGELKVEISDEKEHYQQIQSWLRDKTYKKGMPRQPTKLHLPL